MPKWMDTRQLTPRQKQVSLLMLLLMRIDWNSVHRQGRSCNSLASSALQPTPHHLTKKKIWQRNHFDKVVRRDSSWVFLCCLLAMNSQFHTKLHFGVGTVLIIIATTPPPHTIVVSPANSNSSRDAIAQITVRKKEHATHFLFPVQQQHSPRFYNSIYSWKNLNIQFGQRAHNRILPTREKLIKGCGAG